MAKYTAQLCEIIESFGSLTEQEIHGKLGLGEYEIFDESYRLGLNRKIINHYFFREIGAETTARWAFMVKREMEEIMPLYNQRYNSTKLSIMPLLDRKTTETVDRTVTLGAKVTVDGTNNTKDHGTIGSNGEGTRTGTNVTESRNVHSETPASLLSMANIEGNVYASDADIGKVTEKPDEKATSKNTNTHDMNHDNTVHHETAHSGQNKDLYTTVHEGFTGSQSELLMKYRQTFVNVDMEVITALSVLFMNIY